MFKYAKTTKFVEESTVFS